MTNPFLSLAVLDTDWISAEAEIQSVLRTDTLQRQPQRICPFPPPPFPMRERGPDGRARLERQFIAQSEIGLAKTVSRKS